VQSADACTVGQIVPKEGATTASPILADIDRLLAAAHVSDAVPKVTNAWDASLRPRWYLCILEFHAPRPRIVSHAHGFNPMIGIVSTGDNRLHLHGWQFSLEFCQLQNDPDI